MGGGCGQTPVPSVGDLSYGGGRPGRARPTATSAQPISTQPRPRTNNVLKKKDSFFLIFLARKVPDGPGGVPEARSAVRCTIYFVRLADCAVGSG